VSPLQSSVSVFG